LIKVKCSSGSVDTGKGIRLVKENPGNFTRKIVSTFCWDRLAVGDRKRRAKTRKAGGF
jgi:hypothetical protein